MAVFEYSHYAVNRTSAVRQTGVGRWEPPTGAPRSPKTHPDLGRSCRTAEGSSVALGHPVHIWAGFSSILFRSCLVWWALIVRIRAGNGASFFWRQGLGKPAGRGELHNMVIRTRLPSLPGKAPETGFRPPTTPKSAGLRLLPVKTGHILNSPRRKPAVFLLHVTHIHGLARIQRPKRPGYPHIAAERENADAVPSVPKPREPTDRRAGDLLRLGNASGRRKRLYAGLW
jgi:hypothetical protein